MGRIKNKWVILGIVIIIVAITCAAFLMMNKKNIVLKNNSVHVEFGENIPMNPDIYLDLDKMNEEIVDEISIGCDAPKTATLEDSSVKECPPVGNYTVTLSYKKEEAKVNVEVSDTTKPSFVKYKDEVGVTKDCNPDMDKIKAEFQANDLSGATISIDDSNVDYSKVGEYEAVVKATDKYNNESNRTLTFVIVEPTITLNKKNETIYVKENVVLEAEIVGKNNKADFTSSDTSVATVDSNGKVTGKKAGKATITAQANGVKATCNITVKKVPSGSSTQTQTVTNPNTGEKEEVVVVKPNPGTGSSSSGSSTGTSSSPIAVSSMLSKFNDARAQQGIKALRWDSSLQSAAFTRAKEITTKFSHVRPDGTSALDMPNVSGEILVMEAYSESQAYNAWMNSASHRSSILESDFSGVYIVRNGNYWVGLFSF